VAAVPSGPVSAHEKNKKKIIINLEGNGHGIIQVLSQNLPEWNKEATKKTVRTADILAKI
jgi:hypothetical protein